MIEDKKNYCKFCEKTYVPIYSKPWWLDAVCGSENWDVWLYRSGEDILAAMPYYKERRGEYRYITKAIWTQNNGIIFCHAPEAKLVARQIFEEKVIDAACTFIESLGLDVYEQQFHYSFRNWLPFFWNGYTALTRYTYVLDDITDINATWEQMSSKARKLVRKGQRNAQILTGLNPDIFYVEHEKVFLKQDLPCPFTQERWERLYRACMEHGAAKIFYAKEKDGNVASVLFLVWDECSAYLLLGGSIPPFQNLDTYSAVIWESIKYASEKNLAYDFEGSMIKRISKAFREFGGEPKPYFRIRKVFNPEIMRAETEKIIAETGGGQ